MKLKQALCAAVVLCGLGVSLVTTGTAFAAVSCPQGTPQAGQSKPTYAECSVDSKATANDLLNTVKNVINVILGILGIVAVIVVILGGFTFITSQGDAGKVMKGRNTILWGVVGFIVALASFLIVNFVLVNVVGGSNANQNNNDYSGNEIHPDQNNDNNNNYSGNTIHTNQGNDNNNDYSGNTIHTNQGNDNNNYSGNTIHTDQNDNNNNYSGNTIHTNP